MQFNPILKNITARLYFTERITIQHREAQCVDANPNFDIPFLACHPRCGHPHPDYSNDLDDGLVSEAEVVQGLGRGDLSVMTPCSQGLGSQPYAGFFRQFRLLFRFCGRLMPSFCAGHYTSPSTRSQRNGQERFDMLAIISSVMDVRSYSGAQPHSSRAALSSRLFGQESAIPWRSGSMS